MRGETEIREKLETEREELEGMKSYGSEYFAMVRTIETLEWVLQDGAT